ncbi:MAG: hypothetical protein JXO44_13895 [Clostridia bacterium]|nr:hypothetical protein [Clostridia bacterium]
MENLLKCKLDEIIKLKSTKLAQQEQVMEIFVSELGWLVLLLDDVEVVTDNWFTSTKYNQSQFLHDENGVFLTLRNVYVKNQASDHTENNPRYNLIFDEITLFTDKIIACL